MKTPITVVLLCLLIIGEIFIDFQPTEGHFRLLSSLQFAVITTAPLFVVIAAVRKASRPSVANACAWLSICVGFTIQFGFHTSQDASKVMLLGISIFIYWVCGFVALFCLGAKKSLTGPSSGTR